MAERNRKEREMTQDEQNLNLLSVFHYVLGGITALFSCFPFLHLAMGIAMLSGKFDGENAPPEFFAWFFVLFPAVLILCGWALSALMIVAGVKLKKRTSRVFCLVVAGLECMFMPFGTVLGVFTIIMLMKDSVKELFEAKNTLETVEG
ncbi:MAG: hypothetical protein AB1374_02115 [Bacillota bacterium]